MVIDVGAARGAPNWTAREKLGRFIWAFAYPLFRFSPRPLWAWRRALLRLFGATIGRSSHIYPSVRIIIPWNITLGAESAIGDRVVLYALGRIKIGARVTVSQYAHLCAGTHDWRQPSMPLLKLPIEVEDDAWICADAFVGPGVKISRGAIIGARSVVMKDVPSETTVVGNPARPIDRVYD